MTNAELIKALRYCISDNADDCDLCPYQSDCKRNGTGQGKMIRAAAAALEAAEQRIAELEAQKPKEGEWIDEQRGRWIYAKCNLCGKVQDVRSNYCPNCGARMRGEHDEQIH